MIRSCIIILALGFLGCGAGSRAAPFSETGQETTGCGSLDDLAPNLLLFVRSPDMAPVADVIQTQLVQTGIMHNALVALLKIVFDAPAPPGMLTPLLTIISNPNAQPLATLVGNLLGYLAGEAPATTPHYGVTTALGRILSECDQTGPMTLLDKMVTTHLPFGCTAGTDGCKLAAFRLLDSAGGLLANPNLASVVGKLNLQSVPEASFVALFGELSSILMDPNFQFARLQTVIQTNLYPLIADPELKTNLDGLLDVLNQMTQPETGLQSALAQTVACAVSKDPDNALDDMAYDLITDPSIQLAPLLTALQSAGNADPDEKVAGWLHSVLSLLMQNPQVNDGLINLVAKVMEAQNASRMIPALIQMGNDGVLKDLNNIILKAINGCSQTAIGTPQ